MVCFVLRPGPPPTGLKPPLINYTSTSTTVATTPMDFMDNESMSPDNIMYDETMTVEGGDSGVAELDPVVPPGAAETPLAGNDTATPLNGTSTPLVYNSSIDGAGGTVSLYGKSSGSDRGKHKTTWNQANRTAKTSPTFNKVGLSSVTASNT